MVEPRHQPSAPTGRYSGVKEPLIRNWDRNKARMESIYQTPIRDFRQTAAQFGVPLSAADLTTTEKGVPKMECTTTTKSDYCAPSLDRYLKVAGVCPGRDYPSSSGLEYCPGREPEMKAVQQPISSPTMPLTKSTCPSTLSSLFPKAGPVPQLKYPPTLPQYSTARENEFQLTQPSQNQKTGPKDVKLTRPEYYPNVDYSSAQPGFNWPIPTDQLMSRPIQVHGDKYVNDMLPKEEVGHENVRNTPPSDYSPQIQEVDKESKRVHFDYNVETDDHAEKRQLHDISIESARREYEKMIGVPGSTVPLVKAGADPPNAVAHYNVPDYTQGSPAGGIIRQKFGAPNWEMNIPITDPSYPKPVNQIPPPEPGLTKMGYTGTDNVAMGKPGVTYTPPIRYPDKIYNPPSHSNVEPSLPPPQMDGVNLPDRYSPAIMETPANSVNTCSQQTTGPIIENASPQPTIDATEMNGAKPKVEPPSLKGIRRIQTSNQVYGSWIDDPYLKENDWWFKVRPIKNLKQTYLSKYREESGWL